jgi:hypothetical protein
MRIGADFDQILRLTRAGATRHALGCTLTAMRTGGLSTQGFGSTRQINRDLGQVLKEQGVASAAALLWLRYVPKLLQYVRRSKDFGAL